MAIAPSRVECEQCKASASLKDPVCGSCGGRIIKLCGSCDWKLSAAKKYCDSCGEPQEMTDPVKKAAPPPPSPAQKAKPPPEPERPAPKPEPERKEAFPSPPPRAQTDAPDMPRTIIRRDGERDGERDRPPRPEEPKAARREDGKKGESEEDRKGRRPAEEAPGVETPPARRPEPAAEPAPREKARAPREPRRERPRPAAPEPPAEPKRPVLSTLLGLALLLAGGGLFGYYRLFRRTPERLLSRTVERYLSALKENRVEDAYEILSSASRKSCSLERFRELQEPSPWSYGKIQVRSLKDEHALIRYELAVPQKPAERDWLHFVREEGRWHRVYWWHLMEPIEGDLEARDPEAAYAKAVEAARINPWDPMTHGYLCESAYAREDYKTAEAPCLRALELAEDFPSRLDDDALFQLRLILADLYRNRLGNLARAAQEYDVLLAFPRLSEERRCDIHIAAADAYFELADYPKAMRYYRDGATACQNEEDLGLLERNTAILGGESGPEAVALLQRHKMPGEKLTLFEWRKKVQEELAQRLKLKRPAEGAAARSEDWTPKHLGGPAYEVSVKNDGAEVLSGTVDLWTRKVKVKLNVQ